MNAQMRKVYNYLLSGIADGSLKPGVQIPTEKAISNSFHTNRMNVTRSLQILRTQRLLRSNKKAGTIVHPDADIEYAHTLLHENSRTVLLLYSKSPQYIHWDTSSFEALESELKKKNYSIVYKHIPGDKKRESLRHMLSRAVTNEVTAIVLFPDTDDTAYIDENCDLFISLKPEVFFLNRGSRVSRFDFTSCIELDNYGDGIAMGRIIAANKYSKVVILGDVNSPDFWHARRMEGVIAGFKAETGVSHGCMLTGKNDYGKVMDIIRNDTDKSEIFIAALNQYYASVFIDFCIKENLHAGKDFNIAAFDDNPQYRSYNVTSFAVPFQYIGSMFGKLILGELCDSRLKRKITLRVNSHFIQRTSCRPLKVSGALGINTIPV